MSRRKRVLVVVVCTLCLLGAALLWWLLAARPAFDPETVGRAEASMWRSYYDGNRAQLAVLLVQLLRKQHGLTPVEARRVGELLAEAAMTFRPLRGDYERHVLPPLTRAYGMLKEATDAAFDPEDVARAELAWWVARRTPGHNSAEEVGRGIAALYAALQGRDHPAFQRAGLLRAQAARLRDRHGADTDWAAVEVLLVDSYTALAEGL